MPFSEPPQCRSLMQYINAFHCIFQGITKEHFEKIGNLKDYYFSLHNKSPNEELGENGYKYMAECLKYERQRIGGDWVVAQAVPSRNMREVIRKVLGDDLIFIILRLLELIFLNTIDRKIFLIDLGSFRWISK